MSEVKYLSLLKKVLDEGIIRSDRTGVGTRSIFGECLKFSLSDGALPLLTTKKVYWKGVVEELLFFLRGEEDTKLLEAEGVNIWKGNTSREFLDFRGLTNLPVGSMGKGYGYQWRRFGETTDVKGIDQLAMMLIALRSNPTDRRIMMSAWNPQQLNDAALPPCHTHYQCYVDVEKQELSAVFYMRSVDTFLGLPFNIASYATLTHILAHAVGLKAKELTFMGGDVHIYLNHIEQVKQQIERIPSAFPTLMIKDRLSSVESIEKMSFNSFELIGYNPQSAIKAEMAI